MHYRKPLDLFYGNKLGTWYQYPYCGFIFIFPRNGLILFWWYFFDNQIVVVVPFNANVVVHTTDKFIKRYQNNKSRKIRKKKEEIRNVVSWLHSNINETKQNNKKKQRWLGWSEQQRELPLTINYCYIKRVQVANLSSPWVGASHNVVVRFCMLLIYHSTK